MVEHQRSGPDGVTVIAWLITGVVLFFLWLVLPEPKVEVTWGLYFLINGFFVFVGVVTFLILRGILSFFVLANHAVTHAPTIMKDVSKGVNDVQDWVAKVKHEQALAEKKRREKYPLAYEQEEKSSSSTHHPNAVILGDPLEDDDVERLNVSYERKRRQQGATVHDPRAPYGRKKS